MYLDTVEISVKNLSIAAFTSGVTLLGRFIWWYKATAAPRLEENNFPTLIL